MNAHKTITSIVLAGLITTSYLGCSGSSSKASENNANNKQQNNSTLTPEDYAAIAEHETVYRNRTVAYNKAIYLQQKQIIKQNEILLREAGRISNVSAYAKEAECLAAKADNESVIPIKNADYSRVEYLLNQAILEQQKILKNF